MAADEANIKIKDYEDALLGFIILKPDPLMLDVREVLPDETYFTDPVNKYVYKTFCKLSDEDNFPEDAALVVQELYTGTGKNSKFTSLEQAGRYVNSLIKDFTMFNPEAYKEYAERIKWNKDKAEVKLIAQQVLSTADQTSYNDREQFLSQLETKLGHVTLSIRENKGLQAINEITDATLDRLQRLHAGERLNQGTKTGIHSLDRKIGGFNPGEVIVLAAATGSGKTALSMAIAENVAMYSNKSVIIFSLEMMNEQLTDRMVARLARVNVDKFQKDSEKLIDGFFKSKYSQNYHDQVKEKLNNQYWRSRVALDYINTLPIYTTTAGQLNVNVIKSMIQQKKREIENEKKPELGLIVIDYLQIMQPVEVSGGMSRSDIVGGMSRKVKQIAKEFGVPILLLAQLNRQADGDEAPELKHLRESGSIEQDADKVLFIYGKNAHASADDYRDLADPYARDLMLQKEKMKVRIRVAKNRQGESGDVDVVFDWALQDFVSQNAENALGAEPFDVFFDKYYRKTRSGEDLFWPIKSDDMIPGMENYRTAPFPEMEYLDAQNNIVRSSRKSNEGGLTIKSLPLDGQNSNVRTYTDDMYNKTVVETAIDDDDDDDIDIPAEIDDVSVDFDEGDEELDLSQLDMLDKLTEELNE